MSPEHSQFMSALRIPQPQCRISRPTEHLTPIRREGHASYSFVGLAGGFDLLYESMEVFPRKAPFALHSDFQAYGLNYSLIKSVEPPLQIRPFQLGRASCR